MSNPHKIPNVVISLLNKPKELAIEYIKNIDKSTAAAEYMFRVSNDNILSFSHSYNFDRGSENIGNLITLELVDPENVFEYNLFSNYDLLTKSQADITKARQDTINAIETLIKTRNALQGYLKSPGNTTFKLNNLTTVGNSAQSIAEAAALSDAETTIINNISKALPTDPDINKSAFSKKIVEVLKNKKLLKFEFDTQTNYQKNITGVTKSFDVSVSATFSTSSIDDILGDLSLDNLENKKKIIPTPYFYFYYGLNDNPDEWTGPVAAQFTDAKYNYSFDSGKKSITMNFTTTYDWPAFSKLALDVRGFTTTITPQYTCIGIIKPANSNTSYRDFSIPDVKFHDVLVGLIENYIDTCTNNIPPRNKNTLVLLPDLDKILKQSFDAYINSLELSGGTSLQQSAYKVDAYTRLLEDMGFSTAYFPQQLTPIKIGDTINIPNQIYKNLRGFAQGDLNNSISGRDVTDDFVLGVSVNKDITESFKEPLQKIMTGIRNKISIVEPAFEVIDDLQFVNELSDFLYRIKSPLAAKIEKDKPIIVFGDRYIIEKYLYGKKFYSLTGIIEEGSVLTSNGDPAKATSFESRVQLNANKLKNTDGYVDANTKIAFTDEYIETIAAKYFLKINSVLKINSSLYTVPDDVLSINAVNQNIKRSKIPIFKSGVKESNILSIDLNFNDFYFAALKSIWSQSEVLNLVANDSPTTPPVKVNELDSFTSTELNKIREYVDGIVTTTNKNEIDLISLYNKLNEPNSALFTKFKTLDDTTRGKQLELLLRLLQEERKAAGTPLKIMIGSHENINSYISMISIFSKLVNSAYEGIIKTIPSFHISGTALSTPPILLVLEEVNTVPYKSKGFITRALNGLYAIRGYKHTISGDEIHSEFYIVKSIKLDLPIGLGGNNQ